MTRKPPARKPKLVHRLQPGEKRHRGGLVRKREPGWVSPQRLAAAKRARKRVELPPTLTKAIDHGSRQALSIWEQMIRHGERHQNGTASRYQEMLYEELVDYDAKPDADDEVLHYHPS